MIQAESFQAGRDLVHDVSARQADGVRPRPHPRANLGRDDDVLALDAKITQSLANLNLGLPFGIDVGGIDEIDSSLKSAADELGGGDLIERPNIAPHSACAAAVKGHRAKTDFRNILARAAKRSIAHETSVPYVEGAASREWPAAPHSTARGSFTQIAVS